MVRAYDVEPNRLVKEVAGRLREMGIERPAFVGIVKSGAHAERPPEDPDFWFVRCASVMRQAYVNPGTGVQRLRRHYGGRKGRGVKPQKHRPAGGSTIRKAMQALEKAGLMRKARKGRELTPKGRALLDKAATAIKGG
ncbi:MAG: 30S ribosomal protein S19e [Candidatus Micrarchaeota archaeon]